jgi:hypothetical protein
MLLFLSRAGRGDGERFRPNARFFEEIARSSLARASRRRIRPDPARSHVTFYASFALAIFLVDFTFSISTFSMDRFLKYKYAKTAVGVKT